MSWQPGQPVVTPQDHVAWRTWRKARALAAQRARRAKYRRIDYYPDGAAGSIIDNLTGPYEGADYSGIINRIVVEWAENSGTEKGATP